jgi:hypothetical protein
MVVRNDGQYVLASDYEAVTAALAAELAKLKEARELGALASATLRDESLAHQARATALAAELASTKEMDKLHDRQAHEYYEELKDAESSIALLSARNEQLEAALREAINVAYIPAEMADRWGIILRSSAATLPRVAHSKSEYKRLTALGVECAPPATPNYNIPPWHLSKRVPGCRCDGCQSLLVGKMVVAGSVKETDPKHGQPLSTEERAIVDQYLIDVTCPRCYSVKHLCVCPKETKVITEHAVDPTPFSKDPLAYHLCPICKNPMKRIDAYEGPCWMFDCKCLDHISTQSNAIDPTPFSNESALRDSGFRAETKTKCAQCVYDVRNPDWCEICGTQSSAEEAGAKP